MQQKIYDSFTNLENIDSISRFIYCLIKIDFSFIKYIIIYNQ